MRQLKDGAFRVSCCKAGHVTLEVLDGDAVVFISVMSRSEAFDLSSRLRVVGEHGGRGRRFRSLKDVQ